MNRNQNIVLPQFRRSLINAVNRYTVKGSTFVGIKEG